MTADIKTDAPIPPDISKYKAILSKDPNSMVFAPLAEAYRKAGMLDEAIGTAQEGLKLHPNYLSGMVALGRTYFEKGMPKEAEEVLSKVVQIVPDNVVANNLLEEIRKQSAVSAQQSMESEETELVEVEDVENISEAEEIEEGEEKSSAFGEEITEELWTGESIPEKKAESKKGITTETIAELYIKQGYIDKAIDIYQTLYDADPYNEEIKGKLDELKGRLEVGSQESGVSLTPTLSPEGRGGKVGEDENVKRLKAWLKTIQDERRKG